MVPLFVNKLSFSLVFFLGLLNVFSQDAADIFNPKDYKDKAQFEKFRKRRMVIAAWQINQLKEGALVVRLKTNKKLIDALNKQGKIALAEEKRLEQMAINLNTMRAYLLNYTFSKIYFIYSNSSDSLLQGARTNIFLDTSLLVNKTITMKETFYLLAERDYAYNSSIGFVPEDSAKVQIETGNSIKEVPIVIKNKYGHQLKGPFPYYVGEKFDPSKKIGYVTYFNFEGFTIPFNIGGTKNTRGQKTFKYKEHELLLNIPKHFTYQKLSVSVDRMNDYLLQFYQSSPLPDINKIDQSVKPFLY